MAGVDAEAAVHSMVECPSADSDCSSQGASEYESNVNVQTLMRCCNVLAVTYLACSVITFNSSPYTGPGSALDAVVVMVDVITIDISSALFVMAGLVCARMHYAMDEVSMDTLVAATACAMALDMGIATVLSLLLGGLHALLMHRFKWADVGFTLLEGATTLRGLDFQQAPSAPHSYNVSAWPVQSLVWCILTTKSVLAMDTWIAARFPALADVCIVVMALAGIVLFTVFGPMQASSNIFYANACSVTFRSMEFNLGVHLFFLSQRHPQLLCVVRGLAQKARCIIVFCYVTVWWSEVGRPVPPSTTDTCLRLYFRNPCLQDHHAFFLRGCLLACLLFVSVDAGRHSDLARELQGVQVSSSGVALCWPLCIFVKLVLDITFGETVMAANRPVVSVLCLSIVLVVCFFYNSLVKPPVVNAFMRRFARPASAARSPGTLET